MRLLPTLLEFRGCEAAHAAVDACRHMQIQMQTERRTGADGVGIASCQWVDGEDFEPMHPVHACNASKSVALTEKQRKRHLCE